MKKTIFIVSFLCCVSLFAQEYPKNEIKLNIANTIVIASVEVGYSRFIDTNQSVEAVLLINDRMNYHTEKGSRDFSTNTVKLGYNYYFDRENTGGGIYANPFVKYRFGKFEEKKAFPEATPPTTITVKTDMDSFIVGIGAGYIWNFNNKFVIGPFANIGRNFSDEVQERFTAIEFNAGVNIGYRF